MLGESGGAALAAYRPTILPAASTARRSSLRGGFRRLSSGWSEDGLTRCVRPHQRLLSGERNKYTQRLCRKSQPNSAGGLIFFL